MGNAGLSRKKRTELQYMNEARRASSVFPTGELIAFEKPDFLLHSDKGTIGIEVTELCEEQPRAEGGRLAKVADKAQACYGRLANSEALDVGAAFTPHTENVNFQRLTSGLVNFVHSHQDDMGSFNWNSCDLPEGYCYIVIHKPLETVGKWRASKTFSTNVAPKELIAARLQEKNQRLSEYRAAPREVWLLIVNDQFLGAGEVYARPDHLATWKFAFDFDKVLLFSREMGGEGEVIELRSESVKSAV